MTQFKSHLWVTVAVLVLALAAWFGNKGSRATVQTQEADKVWRSKDIPINPCS